MNLRRHWPVIAPFALAFGAFHAWFASGLLLGDDQFRFSRVQLASYFPWRNAWDPSVVFGVSSADASPAYPLWAAIGALTHIGASFALVERLLWFWPLFFLIVLTPYAFIYRLTSTPWAASVAAAVFAVNTWTVSLVQRGHIPSLVACALMPAVAYAWVTLLRRRRPLDAIVFAALSTLQVMYDLRYAYITAIACLIIAVSGFINQRVRRRVVPAKNLVVAGLWVVVTLIAFNAYWLIPLAAAPAHLPAGYDSLAAFVTASQSQSLAHAIALFYPFYHYVQGADPFKPSAVEPTFFVVFAFVVVAFFAARSNWIAAALAACAVVGIVLTAGPLSPFGTLDDFVFTHVPGMKLFRDISKFSALIALAYASLLGMGCARLFAALRDRAGIRSRVVAAVLACVAVASYAWVMRDAFNPLRLSNFATTTLSPDDVATQAFLDRQPGYFRTLLYPTWQPELVGTAAHPVVSADYLFDSAPADGGLADFFPTFATLTTRLESPLIPDMLKEASVRYVVVDDDPKGILYKPFAYGVTHAESVVFFRARPWLRQVGQFGGYVVFELTTPPAPRAFFAASPVKVRGSPADLVALVGTPDWAVLPGAIIDPSQAESASRRAFVADTTGGETVTGDLATSAPERVRAWVGAQPFDVLAQPLARARMRSAVDLVTSPIPGQAVLPAPPVTVEIRDPRIISAPFAYSPIGSQWRGIVGPVADIELTNWSGATLTADVSLPDVFVPSGATQIVRVAVRDATQSFDVSGTAFGIASHMPITLRGVRLEPGLNLVHLGVSTRRGSRIQAALPDAYSLIFADRVSIDTRAEAETIAHTVAPPNFASFVLFPHLSIPLTRKPTIAVDYEASQTLSRLALYSELRRRDDGTRIEFVHALPSASNTDSVDLFAAVQTALDDDTRAVTSARTIVDASGYDLVAVRLAIVAPTTAGSPAISKRSTGSEPTIEDARIDAPQTASDALPVVRFVDLRTAAISTSGHADLGPRLLRFAHAGTNQITSATVNVPIADSGDAQSLVFWLRTEPDSAPRIYLSFWSHEDSNAVTVPAAARPSFRNASNDPTPSAWQKIVPHALNGDIGQWHRYVIDVGDVKAYRVRNGGAGFRLTALRIDARASGPISSADLSDLALVSPPLKAAGAVASRPVQSLVLDGREIPIERWRRDPMTGRLVGETVQFTLKAGAHRISVEPALPLRATSIYISQERPAPTEMAAVDNFAALSPSEYSADVRGNGLFVWPMSFAPGWQAYAIPAGGASPTGLALIDALRLRSNGVPATRHVAVNGAFNGWYLAPGTAHVVLLYVPEAASEFAAIVWLLLSLAVVIAALAVPRGRP